MAKTGSWNSTVRYLVILALSRGSIVQLKGLFDQPSLPLPLSLRAMRCVRGAVALIPTSKKLKNCPGNNVTVNHVRNEQGKSGACYLIKDLKNWVNSADTAYFLWMTSQSSV